MKRPHSATHNHRLINPQANNFISPNYFPNFENYPQTNNYIKEEGFEEEMSLLQIAWNELGVTPEYRQVFINILKEANETEKNNIFIEEKNNMKKFRDSLLNLKKEIENREKNLAQLKKFNYLVQSIITNGEEVNSINQILQNVISLIKNLRINAVNIVKKIIKVNHIISYSTNSGKFNFIKIKPEYSYDPRYLFKMKEDLKFLKNSALSTFIEMNNSSIDPFLTNCAPSNKGAKSSKIVIPISDDIMKLIIQSRYELLQETVLDNIEKNDKNNGLITNTKSMDFFEFNSFYKKKNRGNPLNNFEKEKFRLKLGSGFRSNNQNKFKDKFIHSTRGQNISRYLYNLKNSGKINYDNYFYVKRNNSPLVNKKRFSGNKLKNNNINKNSKIIIMHEEIESLKHDQFMKRLGSIQNLDNSYENNKETEKNIEKEILNENIEDLKNEILELKTRLKNWELKSKNESERRENLEIKNKEIIGKNKEYQNELEKITKNKKKKENELNNKIEILSKEIQVLKSQKEKDGDDLIGKLKFLEEKFQNEESLRKNGEKIIENLERNLKEEIMGKEKIYLEKIELEKNIFLYEENIKKISEGKNMIEEENIKLKEEIKNLEKSKQEKDYLLQEKELENQKIISDKNLIENEKLNTQNEYTKLKDEFELYKSQHEKEKNDLNELINNKNNFNTNNEIQSKEEIFIPKKTKPENIYNNVNSINIPGMERPDNIVETIDGFEIIRQKINNNEYYNNIIKPSINSQGEGKLISLNDQIKYNEEEVKENNNNINNEEIISDKNFNFNNNDNKKNSLLNLNYTNSNNKDKDNEILKSQNPNSIKNSQQEINDNNNPDQTSNYTVDYYRDNIFNLLQELNETIALQEIPDFLKRAFALDDSIFTENFYFKGIFPKIIVSKSLKDNNKITGMLSFYYESTEDLNQKLILRINSIIVDSNYEEQIINMVNFLKDKVECDKIMVYILYDRIGNKFITNSEAKDIFINKLKFKWFCVVRDEKLNQRYIQYAFSKIEEIYDPNKNETTLYNNALKHNKNNFLMNNVMISSINQEQNINLIKNNFSEKFSYTKFMNPNLVYFVLMQTKNINSYFYNNAKYEELKKMNEKIMKYINIESNYGKEKVGEIKYLEEEMDNSIYKEINEFLEQKNNINCVPDILRTKLSINFENNYSTIIDNVYYNRISTDKISMFEEEKSGAKFFLIPSKDNNTLFYISEINYKLKDLLIDGNKNVYEKFLEFQPSTQRQIFEFSVKSIRDISYIPLTPRRNYKTIYIPCFAIKSHLFTYDFKEINKNVKMKESDTNIPLNLASVEEFINVEFKPDNNIENSFSTVEGCDYMIQDSFIVGIFDNDIINNSKLPLLQFLYITKDNFLTKNNYILDKQEFE